MKVRRETTSAGPEGVFLAGSEVDLPADEAKRLIAGGYATAIESPSLPAKKPKARAGVETAALETGPERAVAPSGKRKKRH